MGEKHRCAEPELNLWLRKAHFWEPNLNAGWKRYRQKWPALGWASFQTKNEKLIAGGIVICLPPFVIEKREDTLFCLGDFTRILTHEWLHILIKTNGGYITTQEQDHWIFNKMLDDMEGV